MVDRGDPVSRGGLCAYAGCDRRGDVVRQAFCSAVLYCDAHFRLAERLFNRPAKETR